MKVALPPLTRSLIQQILSETALKLNTDRFAQGAIKNPTPAQVLLPSSLPDAINVYPLSNVRLPDQDTLVSCRQSMDIARECIALHNWCVFINLVQR